MAQQVRGGPGGRGRWGRGRGGPHCSFYTCAGDSMSYHSGSVFSARDRDPNNLLISCAVSYRGAWWYRNCHYANLNGLYGSTVDHQVRGLGGSPERGVGWGTTCWGVAGRVTKPLGASGPSSVKWKNDANLTKLSEGGNEHALLGVKGQPRLSLSLCG